MRKLATLTLMLLLAASLTWAQQSTTPSNPDTSATQSQTPSQPSTPDTSATQSQTPSQPSSPTGASSEETVQGCLSGSSGNYTLTDDKGTTYQLKGDDSMLQPHVGHQVAVAGKMKGSESSGGAETGAASPSSSTSGGQVIRVTSVQMIASTCSSTPK